MCTIGGFICTSFVLCLLYSSKPIIPCQGSVLNEDGLILSMVTETVEKDATTQQRDLKSLYIDVDSMFVPCVGSDSV